MARTEQLTLQSISKLASLNGVYMLGYAWVFGTAVWVTFFGGVIAYRALPRQQFGALQHRVFPVYFVQSILLSSTLLGIWVFTHPDVTTHISNPLIADVAQVYALGSAILAQGANYFVIGPMTSRTMFQRHKLEKEEGKAYTDPGASPEMKTLTRKFASLHGVSSLANLWSVIALGFHGLWIGNAGIRGY